MKNTKTFNDFLKESETVYHSNDFLGMQAQMANMSREEWIAHYGTSTIGSGIDEKNADGTVSDDEDEREEELMANVEAAIDDLVYKIKQESNDIGGSFRAPGIQYRDEKLLRDKLKKARML